MENIRSLFDCFRHRRAWVVAIVIFLLLAAAFLAQRVSIRWILLIAGGMGGVLLLNHPSAGLFLLIFAALLARQQISTDTEVSLNLATLFVPGLFVVWVVDMMRRRQVRLAPSRVNLPLILFLVSGLLSLVAGNALWNPVVPRSSNLVLVQLAQWGIFVFSAGAFWITAELVKEEQVLTQLTFFFVALAGIVTILKILPGIGGIVKRFVTVVVIRAPFWIALVSLAFGQLVFNKRLSQIVRIFLVVVVIAAFYNSLVVERESISTWAPLVVVFGVLVWLRLPSHRWVLAPAMLVGILAFFNPLYEFAGGDAEWVLSGGSRLALIRRVVRLTMYNPILGLGPASYRHYGFLEPLSYNQVTWMQPTVSSHNNYIDIFAQMGIIGLGLFLWFMAELYRLGWRLHKRYKEGFVAGYVNGMLAALVAISAAMMLLDWFLPFVYNVGFLGFQASVLLWMFLGGLVAVDQWDGEDPSPEENQSSLLEIE